MRRAKVFVHGQLAGVLEEHEQNRQYAFSYLDEYKGPALSMTLPLENRYYEFDSFPSFFDGLLPEGEQLEALLRQKKIDRQDHFSQLVVVGNDLVGAITVAEAP
jgi:serine/threonine-protein kinase HipA